MIVTKKFLLDNRTSSKGWTKAQFVVLGLPFPPRAGWMALVKGRVLTEQEAKLFEDGKYASSESGIAHIKHLIRKLAPDQISHLIEWTRRL